MFAQFIHFLTPPPSRFLYRKNHYFYRWCPPPPPSEHTFWMVPMILLQRQMLLFRKEWNYASYCSSSRPFHSLFPSIINDFFDCIISFRSTHFLFIGLPKLSGGKPRSLLLGWDNRTTHKRIWQIPKPLTIAGHVINSSSCAIYSTSTPPPPLHHPSTILRGRCLTSGEKCADDIHWA